MGVMAATAVEDVTNTTPLASAAAHRVFLSNSSPPLCAPRAQHAPPRSSDDLNPSPCGRATRPLPAPPHLERSSSAHRRCSAIAASACPSPLEEDTPS